MVFDNDTPVLSSDLRHLSLFLTLHTMVRYCVPVLSIVCDNSLTDVGQSAKCSPCCADVNKLKVSVHHGAGLPNARRFHAKGPFRPSSQSGKVSERKNRRMFPSKISELRI